jgi:NAD(P)-dependent dehydrogenase (short-subunit alcohol dehydrogenase family)
VREHKYSHISLKGQTAFVTGGDSDIGEAICYAFAECGASIVIAARDKAKMDKVKRNVETIGAKTLVVHADVIDEESVTEAVATAKKKFRRIDILVNAAGVTGPVETPLHNVTESDWDYVIDSNVKGTFLPCKAVVPLMIKQKYGRIINIAGSSGLRGYVNRAAYSSSKWALRGLTRTLALEVGKHNVTVNTICPGVVEGRRMSSIIARKAKVWRCSEKDVYGKYVSEMALGRFSLPEDIARAAVFLASAGGRQITGHDVTVDGGWDV